MHLESQNEPQKPSRKGKERDHQRDPQPTDLAEKLIAFQRRNAGATRPREKSERTPTAQLSPSLSRPERPSKPTSGSALISRPSTTSPRKQHPLPHLVPTEADPDDFSRRLKISSSPVTRTTPSSSKHHNSKLFNPDTDPIPMKRTAEPESMSDAISSSYPPRGGHGSTLHIQHRDAPARQLFDHRKDDPVRFSVLARPHGRPPLTPKSSGDHVSASSTSSYANSMTSSNFTLSSNTDGSSASSAIFERQGQQQSDEAGNNVFAVQLKKLYRAITNLEAKVKQEDLEDNLEERGRIMLKGKEINGEEYEREKWKKQIADHKRLAEITYNLLEISLAPSVPASLRNIPTKYNIIVRLWTYGFHKLLESLRRASFSSPLALEHLQDFIYYAYTFYTGLLEEPMLSSFKSGWLEALGDLARYRMAVAAMVTGNVGSGTALTTAAVSEAAADASESTGVNASASTHIVAPPASKSVSDGPAARIDDSPSPSVGLAAARLLDVEPEKERWRGIARDWYGAGLADQPGTGKLHHHLGLLSREVEGEDLRGVYHYVKSMTTLHPFTTSRESVLPIWSAAAQARRSLPDARVPDLFVLLHGMLFTNIQLDDFQPTLARLVERLEIDGAEEREWIMMAVVNLGAVLEYGKPGGVLKRAGGVGPRESGPMAMRVMAKKGAADEESMDVDGEHGADVDIQPVSNMTAALLAHSVQVSPAMSDVETDLPEQPAPLKLALQLTFAIFSHVLQHPTRKASPFARSTLNPYLTVLLTFLATVMKHPQTLEVVERSIPWEELAGFLARVPRSVMAAQGLSQVQPHGPRGGDRWGMLTSGCAPPLKEDWCLRGLEWVGRKVYERGFWKSGEERKVEIEVLDESEAGEITDGHIEDDDDDEGEGNGLGEMKRRWVRIVRCAIGIASAVDGFTWVEGTREWKVEGLLAEKVEHWREADRIQQEEEERRRMGTRWADDSMDVDGEVLDDGLSEESDDEDEDHSEEVKALKARRRYLRSLLQSSQRGPVASSPPKRLRPRTPRKEATARARLSIVAGYTVLVVDTNIVLSSLPMFASVVESLRWTVVVPLPVIMELEGLSSSTSQLGEAAQAAMAYISSHIRSHSISLKVQTSKGNYLTTLSVRTEQVDFANGTSERNMDDLILKAAIWQDDHWVDRSAMLKADIMSKEMAGAIKVVLLSLDRNLRLKARSRQLPAASETDLASILAAGT